MRKVKVKVDNPCTGLDRPWRFQEFECPRYHDSRHKRVVSLSAPRTCRLYPQEIFLVFASLRGSVDPRAIARPEELCQYKIPMKTSGIEIANLGAVAQCPNQTRQYESANKYGGNTMLFVLGPIKWQIGLNHCCLIITSFYTGVNLSCLLFYATHLYLPYVNQLPLFLFASLLSESNWIGVVMLLDHLTIAKLSICCLIIRTIETIPTQPPLQWVPVLSRG